MFTLSIGSPWNGMSLYTTRAGIVQWCLKWAKDNPKHNVENLEIEDSRGNRCRFMELSMLNLLPQGSYVHG